MIKIVCIELILYFKIFTHCEKKFGCEKLYRKLCWKIFGCEKLYRNIGSYL